MRITDISVSFEKLENLEAQKAKEEGRSKTTVRVEASVHQPGEFDDDEDDDDDEIGF